jgi:integrase/recombinase XerC
MTTTAMVKIESKEIKSHEGTINSMLIDRWLRFACVSESSEKTYRKALRQLFAFFAANGITSPTRDDLRNWILGLRGASTKENTSEEEKTPALLLDNKCVLHYDGEIADDGAVYKVVGKADTKSGVKLFKGNELVGKSKSPSTINLYLAAAKLFFRWLHVEGAIEKDICDHMKGLKPAHGHKKDTLEPDQCKALVDSVKVRSTKDLQGLRNRAILNLLVTTGLRTVEVVRADIGDVRLERGKNYLYIQGKGRTVADEKVLLSKQTFAAISAYLDARKKAQGKIKSDEPLFLSAGRRYRGARLTTQTISRLVKRQLRAIELDSPRLTAHSLRHSVATNLVYEGVELPTVQQVMRHSSLNTTMIYQHAFERYINNSEQILANKIFGAD